MYILLSTPWPFCHPSLSMCGCPGHGINDSCQNNSRVGGGGGVRGQAKNVNDFRVDPDDKVTHLSH